MKMKKKRKEAKKGLDTCMETMVLYGNYVYGSLWICMDCYVSKDSWVLNLVFELGFEVLKSVNTCC